LKVLNGKIKVSKITVDGVGRVLLDDNETFETGIEKTFTIS
jgi:hypothetical protein